MESFSGRQHRPATAQAEQQPVTHARPTEPARSVHHGSAKKSRKSPIKWVIIGVLIALLVAAGIFGAKVLGSPMIDSGKYQAVFLTNGQVYFGKLSTAGNYYTLKKVFYLQTTAKAADSTNPQETTPGTDSNVQLIKLGNEVHGPEDKMTIERSQVLFFEDLKSDGKVSDSISKYDQTKK